MRQARKSALRRLAIQLAGQLPDDKAEALLVLEYTAEIVSEFLAKNGKPPRRVRAA